MRPVVPFKGEDRMAVGRTVFVKASLMGQVRTDSERGLCVEVLVKFAGGLHETAYVPMGSIIAMVEDDDRYAFCDEPADLPPEAAPIVTPTARGFAVTFDSPAQAAKHLTALGWTVTPPDAHAEPIGEPRYYVREVLKFGGAAEFEVLDRTRGTLTFPDRWRAAGPFPTRNLAQAEADDLNIQDQTK